MFAVHYNTILISVTRTLIIKNKVTFKHSQSSLTVQNTLNVNIN